MEEQSQNGLPAGSRLYTLTPSNTILISGSVIASTTFTTPTVNYAYEIVTGGRLRTSSTLNGGTITVSLSTSLRTDEWSDNNKSSRILCCHVTDKMLLQILFIHF